MKTIAAVLIGVSIAYAYHLGSNAGYSQGWSDAHCGSGLACEAGQE